MKVYTVQQLLTMKSGSTTQLAVACFSDEALAIKDKTRAQDELKGLLSAELFFVRDGGASQVGMTAGMFMSVLGIVGFAHTVSWAEVRDSDIVVASAPNLILPH